LHKKEIPELLNLEQLWYLNVKSILENLETIIYNDICYKNEEDINDFTINKK
jgi:hypothetical protein